MKLTELLSIPLRIFGIYFLYSAFLASIRQYHFLVQAASITNDGEYRTYIVIAVIEAGVLIISGLALLKLPLTISRLLISQKDESQLSTTFTTDQMQSVAFCILGVYIISSGIPDFVNNASWIIYYSFQLPADRNNYVQLFISELITSVELFIGVYLCIKSEGINILIKRFRTVGTV